MNSICLTGITVHNLKNINVSIPYGSITVITGVSGSGKSSLALDTLYAEGQRRYTESLSAYVRQFLERVERPSVDTISGILPAIAIESKNSISNARSTVGTQTEINDYVRLLFARLGKTYCKTCGSLVKADTPDDVATVCGSLVDNASYLLLSTAVSVGKTTVAYRKHIVKDIMRRGFTRIIQNGVMIRLDAAAKPESLFQNGSCELVIDRIKRDRLNKKRFVDSVEAAYRLGKGHVNVRWFSADDRLIAEKKFSHHFHCASCDKTYQKPTPHMFSFNSPLGACPTCQGFGRIITIDHDLIIPDDRKSIAEGAIVPWSTPSTKWDFDQLKAFCRRRKIPLTKPFHKLSAGQKKLIFEGDGSDEYHSITQFFRYLEKKVYKMHVRVFLSRYRNYVLCPECQGTRFRPESLQVTIASQTVSQVLCMNIDALVVFFDSLPLTAYETAIAGTVLEEVRKRLRFLKDVGLGYITLDRLSRTLSGGEAQRINLASALGASLVDTLYVLDEPSIGLHPRDNALLIAILKKLKKLGNTIVVIEHDKEMIAHADRIIDLGPHAGAQGGRVIYDGTVKGLQKCRASLTGQFFRKEFTIQLPKRSQSRTKKQRMIVIEGASAHNLKHSTVEIPLGSFVALTGVSGSGKSTLLYNVLYNNFLRFRGRPVSDVGAVKRIKGLEYVADMALIDQKPIGKSPRSNPATFMKVFGAIRNVFVQTATARARRMTPSTFSFNVSGGRCEECKGDGTIKVEMHFLADVYMECEACGGKRFKKETLDVAYKGKNIHDVLDLTIDEAIVFFADRQPIVRTLTILHEVGLGYLTLGQPANTLSAGEAQRLKLAQELSDTTRTGVLFLFDEPTVGLHYYDIMFLMNAFGKLLERGNSILMIEHNSDVIRCADHIIDLGPEGGERGGEVVCMGPPAVVRKCARSYTGNYL